MSGAGKHAKVFHQFIGKCQRHQFLPVYQFAFCQFFDLVHPVKQSVFMDMELLGGSGGVARIDQKGVERLEKLRMFFLIVIEQFHHCLLYTSGE